MPEDPTIQTQVSTDRRPIAVLLATYNGARHLPLQLESLAVQSWPRIDIWASDDGSTDGTRRLLEAAAGKWDKGRFVIRDGPQRGNATANFRQLIIDTEGDYVVVAFADQDDIWLPWKLMRAVDALSGRDDMPSVHCSRTQLIDDAGRQMGKSPYFTRPPSFENALVQSLAGGNTMVLNRKAFSLVQRSSQRTGYLAHDWWTYQIVAAAGGQMIYSSVADTLYRQHSNNAVGANMGLVARLRRAQAVLGGRLRRWNRTNVDSLNACRDLMTLDSRRTLEQFQAARSGNLAARLSRLRRSGVYRQTVAGHAMLYVAAALDLL